MSAQNEIPHANAIDPHDAAPGSLVRIARPKRGRGNRRAEILQTLATLLEDPACDRITTALIARRLELSEAALYRSFPSKAAMFSGLIDFIESSLLDLFARIRSDASLEPRARIQVMVNVMLEFADKNPGLCRVMTGQVLLKEDPRLTTRIAHLYDVLEAQIRQTYRDAMLAGAFPADFNASARANLVMTWVLGRWLRFVLTGFQAHPSGVGPAMTAPFLS